MKPPWYQYQYQRNLWSVPVPVRPSHLYPLSPEHKVYNVEVDLAQLAPFGYAQVRQDDDELMYADLQTNPRFNVGLRLGSGRSGFYRGKYLKGVGRTQLAGNWRDPSDVYHGTGHMLASAGVREYIVSCYLRAKGAAHAIVSCEGLLLGPLHDNLRGYEKLAFPGEALCPVDLRFQAITVKDSGFARHSNIVWALNHSQRQGRYGLLFKSLYHYLTSACGHPAETRVGPAEIASALSERAEDGLRHFATYFRHGIYWASFSNNFTLDGRFLDLEVPQIFGRPFLGLMTCGPELRVDLSSTLAPVLGCEAMEYLIQVRYFIEYLVQRLRFLLDTDAIAHPIERAFVAEFLAEVESRFTKDHVILNQDAAVGLVAKAILDNVTVPDSHVGSLRRIVHDQYEACFNQRPMNLSAFTFRPLPLKLARSESIRQYYTFYPDFVTMDEGFEEAEHINRALDALDQQTSLDRLMLGIEQLAGEISALAPPR